MVKAIIFDMDGTLIDSEPYHERVRNQQLAKLNIFDRQVANLAIGRGKSAFYQILVEKFNLNVNAREWAKQDFFEIIELIKKEGILTTPGVYELFEYAKSKGIKMAVGSSSDRNFVEFINDYLGFNKYLDAVVTKDDVENAKPAPDIFLKALDMLGVDAKDTLVIEDAESGTIAAKKANIRSICFDGGESVAIKQNFSLAIAVVKDLKDIIDIIEQDNK